MNFGNNFIKMVNKMYLNNNNFSRILLNGFLGEQINLYRGIRQGDPVSGFLFNISVEVLTKQIMYSKKIIGIKINTDTEIRISQYADDTILFLDGTEHSLRGATEKLSYFSTQSGLKLNWEKTACLSIGSSSPPEISASDIVNKIKRVDEIKILGVYFKRSIDNIADENIGRKVESLGNEIKQWKRRYLTPLGNINIIKSLLLSKLVHLFMALPSPSQSYINPRPDGVWRVTRPDGGVAQRAPLRIFKSKSHRVKIQTALERSRRTLQDIIMLTLFFDL